MERQRGRRASPRRRRSARANPAGPAVGAPSAPAEAPALVVSRETLLWGGLLIGAFALRLARLEAPPLTLEESGRAFAAFRLAHGDVIDGWTGDLAGALMALLFRLFGAGEMTARIVPALAGGALVAGLWFTRSLIGRGAALAAGILLALSPLAVSASRVATGSSLGAVLSLAMVLSLFAYLRQQNLPNLMLFMAALFLAPTVDAVATATAIAVVAFLVLEGALGGEKRLARAFSRFRSSTAHWQAATLVAAVSLTLGLTHYGTSLERTGLAGLRQWGEMFATPGDGRPWYHQLSLLTGYDWPLLLAGSSGLIVVALRVWRGREAVPLFQRFLLLWALTAVLTVALATRRQRDQMLLLLLPLALLSASLLEEVASSLDWSILRRWWLAAAGSLVLIAVGALALTQWAQGQGGALERALLVLAPGGAVAILLGAYLVLGRDAGALILTIAGAIVITFLLHSSLAVILARQPEFALGPRAGEMAEPFASRAVRLAAEGDGVIVVDPELREPLAWYLRDEGVAFGDPIPGMGVAVYVGAPDARPVGFMPEGASWRISEGWYPEGPELAEVWRWLLYRRPFGSLSSTEATIFLPLP